MKYLNQFMIIMGFSLLGEALQRLIPMPIPASVYGIIVLFAALCLGLVKLEQIKETAGFLSSILPVLFVSGEADPVGDFGKGVRMAADTFLAAGMRDVDLWLYTGRHEILNETDRDLVYAELARWLVDIAEGHHRPAHAPAQCRDENCACRRREWGGFYRGNLDF